MFIPVHSQTPPQFANTQRRRALLLTRLQRQRLSRDVIAQGNTMSPAALHVVGPQLIPEYTTLHVGVCACVRGRGGYSSVST